MTDTSKPIPADSTEHAYHPDAVEAKWQARWAERRTNEPDLERPVRPFYNLMMFPYPSAEGLHVGNMFAFTGGDIYGRFKRLQGYDVFEPIGFDAFGIHSENYAIKLGINPAELIPRNIVNFRRQLRRIGGMFDWRHELSTTDPALLQVDPVDLSPALQGRAGLQEARGGQLVPECKTVLANEQVINGPCERCDSLVEQRMLEQWFFRIAEYADRLLANLDDRSKMDWSDTTTTAQRNWIGRSEGAEIDFALDGGGAIRVFTTRPDTLYGATFMVLAPEHPSGGPGRQRRAARRRGPIPEGRRREGPGVSEGGRPGEDRRLHRRLRPQSRERPHDSDLDRRLRAHGIRHRRHHGGPGPRRARLRVRPEVRAADRAGRRRPGPADAVPRSAGVFTGIGEAAW